MDHINTYAYVHPPTVSTVDAVHQLLSYATTNANSISAPWVTDLSTNAPAYKCFVTVEAKGSDAYVRFRDSATTNTTATNGLLIKADQPGQSFYVDPIKHGFLDAIGSAVGTVRIYVSSCPGERKTI